jgi:hypothetical protein
MQDRKNDVDALTAFKDSLQTLRRKLQSATINPDEFQRKLKPCALSCSGMCCYDGASIDEKMGEQIQSLVNERRLSFREMGLHLPATVVEMNNWNGVVGWKTAVRPFPFRLRVTDYPAHFNETACVFLLTDGRCGLQLLAKQEGKHPWYYKPFTCWLQPIKLSDSAIRLYDEASDPNKLPTYDGFVVRTHCGRTEQRGAPAVEVLREELEFLGKLLDRDLLSEINDAHLKTASQKDGDDDPKQGS